MCRSRENESELKLGGRKREVAWGFECQGLPAKLRRWTACGLGVPEGKNVVRFGLERVSGCRVGGELGVSEP